MEEIEAAKKRFEINWSDLADFKKTLGKYYSFMKLS
jgi:hypothetical protein